MTDYTVGYGKPPLHTRFRKGQSGNVLGRPKKRWWDKELPHPKHVLMKRLSKKMVISEGGKQKQVTMLEAWMMSLVTRALKGSSKADDAVWKLLKMDAPHMVDHRALEEQQEREEIARALKEWDLMEEPNYEPPKLTEAESRRMKARVERGIKKVQDVAKELGLSRDQTAAKGTAEAGEAK